VLQSYFVFAIFILIGTSATLNRIMVDLLCPFGRFTGIILHRQFPFRYFTILKCEEDKII